MHLFLTSVLPFLAHDHPAAVAFLTCRYHNFHSSIIPEFLSDEERVTSFCYARQQNQLEVDTGKQYAILYNLFVQTPLMQFSPSLLLDLEKSSGTILKPLLETKYFTRSLQRCSFDSEFRINNGILQCLSKVQSLTKLDLGESLLQNKQMEIIVNSFPSLETLTIRNAEQLRLRSIHRKTASFITSPPPPATKTLRNLTIGKVNPSFATKFIPHFTNVRKLELSSERSKSAWSEYQELDLLPFSSSLPLLKVMSLATFNLKNTESLKNLLHLSTVEFVFCGKTGALSFLTQENSLPELRTLSLDRCIGLDNKASFAALTYATNLHVLNLTHNYNFNNDCLQYLEDMVHLRKLDLSWTKIVGDSRSLKTLMQNLYQLEELRVDHCRIGNQGAIAGALYRTHSRLRVLNLSYCNLVDDDLNGIGLLKKTLEVLHLDWNHNLTSEGLRHCNDLVMLKVLNLNHSGINDLSSLKDCLNLEDLDVSFCGGLTDHSFKVFSEEPNSFANLRVLDLSHNTKLTETVFKHLVKNHHLVYQLKELNLNRISLSKILSASSTARNNICQLKGLRILNGIVSDTFSGATSEEKEVMEELVRRLKNLEEIE